MEIYYADSVTGDDASSGETPLTAWTTLQYAADMLAAGDMLILDAPATTPSRGGVELPSSCICRGKAANDKSYILGSVDASHGAATGNLIVNGGIEAWQSAAEPWFIIHSGDEVVRSTDAHGGTYSLDATRVVGNIYLTFYVYLPASTAMTFSYWHKDGAAGRWQFNIREINPAPDNYLQADGSWAAPNHAFDPADANAAWHSHSLDFTSNAAGRYAITLIQAFFDTVLLDDVSLTYTGAAAYQWSNVAGKNYKVLDIPFPLASNILAKCTAAQWVASGAEALEAAPLAANLAACDIAPGSWYYDAATDLVYYCPTACEDVTALHIEITKPRKELGAILNVEFISLASSNTELWDLKVLFANTHGLWVQSALSGIVLRNVDCYYSGTTCFVIQGGSDVRAFGCTGGYTYGEDIFYIGGAGTVFVADKCIAEYAYDDGFQVGAGASATLIRCVSRLNGTEMVSNNSGFSAEGANLTLVLYNCTAYGNYGRGISCIGTGAGSMTVKNCIAYGTQWSAAADAHTVGGISTFIHANNIFGGHYPAWILDATEQIAAPLFINAPSDLHLQGGSPAIDVGTDVGLPFAGDAPDCGAYEYKPGCPRCWPTQAGGCQVRPKEPEDIW